MALSLAVARYEKKKSKHPVKIVPVYRHAEGCMYSNGACIPPHPCTCHKAVHVGYTLVLLTRS